MYSPICRSAIRTKTVRHEFIQFKIIKTNAQSLLQILHIHFKFHLKINQFIYLLSVADLSTSFVLIGGIRWARRRCTMGTKPRRKRCSNSNSGIGTSSTSSASSYHKVVNSEWQRICNGSSRVTPSTSSQMTRTWTLRILACTNAVDNCFDSLVQSTKKMTTFTIPASQNVHARSGNLFSEGVKISNEYLTLAI